MALAIRDKVIRAKQLEEMVGREAIEISSIAIIGKGPGAMEDRRGKVVLLDFWAVWYVPCQKMLPTLNRFVERHKRDGLEVIGVTKPYNFTWNESTKAPQKMPLETMVSLEDEIEMLWRFHAEQKRLYPTILTSKDGKTQSGYHVDGVPQLILIGRDGRIRKVWVGNVVETKDLEQSLQNALDESP